ncbi:MAG: hypothetical protein JXB05_29030 [Myxococcaceae bacterium]|nr:hypothetical protein [Myxococcaceae bacterium]
METLTPLPSAATLPSLLKEVRSPGVVKADVDALLRGLALPLAEGETPRARADFLLSLLESDDVNDMQGTDGHSVRAVAVQALLDLGYPYALEVPPEALDAARGSRGKTGVQKIPIAGLIATFVGLAVQSVKGLPPAFQLLSSDRTEHSTVGLVLLMLLLGPALSAVLGGWWRIRWLQSLGLLMMTLTGALWLTPLAVQLVFHPWRLDFSESITLLSAGLGFLLGAFLTRRPEWLVEEGTPADKKAPAQAPPPPP